MWLIIIIAIVILLIMFHKVRAHSMDKQIKLYLEHVGGIESLYVTLIEKLSAQITVEGHDEDIVKEVVSFKEIRLSNPSIQCRFIVKSIFGGAYLVRYDREKMIRGDVPIRMLWTFDDKQDQTIIADKIDKEISREVAKQYYR